MLDSGSQLHMVKDAVDEYQLAYEHYKQSWAKTSAAINDQDDLEDERDNFAGIGAVVR